MGKVREEKCFPQGHVETKTSSLVQAKSARCKVEKDLFFIREQKAVTRKQDKKGKSESLRYSDLS